MHWMVPYGQKHLQECRYLFVHCKIENEKHDVAAILSILIGIVHYGRAQIFICRLQDQERKSPYLCLGWAQDKICTNRIAASWGTMYRILKGWCILKSAELSPYTLFGCPNNIMIKSSSSKFTSRQPWCGVYPNNVYY